MPMFARLTADPSFQAPAPIEDEAFAVYTFGDTKKSGRRSGRYCSVGGGATPYGLRPISLLAVRLEHAVDRLRSVRVVQRHSALGV